MRLLFRVLMALCVAAMVALITLAALGGTSAFNRVSTACAAVVPLAGLVLSLYKLRTPGGEGEGEGKGADGGGEAAAVRAVGRGSIAAGGSLIGNAIGANSKVTGVTHAPGGTTGESRPVSAEGEDAIAVQGDVAGNAIGEGSEVSG